RNSSRTCHRRPRRTPPPTPSRRRTATPKQAKRRKAANRTGPDRQPPGARVPNPCRDGVFGGKVKRSTGRQPPFGAVAVVKLGGTACSRHVCSGGSCRTVISR